MQGIPTVYNGVQYRSRLEAKWACFFDHLGWPYEYEPFDLEGWIPDFLLTGINRVLVEVKPVSDTPNEVMAEVDACPGGRGYEILIVGCAFPRVPSQVLDPSVGFPIGWLRTAPASWNRGNPTEWGLALAQRFTFRHWDGSVADLGIGFYSSCDHRMHCDPGFAASPERLIDFAQNRPRGHGKAERNGVGPRGERVVEIWSRAANLTQWRGRQAITT